MSERDRGSMSERERRSMSERGEQSSVARARANLERRRQQERLEVATTTIVLQVEVQGAYIYLYVELLGPMTRLSTKAVEGPSLPLQSVDDIHGGDGLSSGVLGVGDGITDDVLEEDLEDSSGLLVDESGDTLDTTTSSETSDGGLGDSLDVVSQDLPVTLGATLSESLSSLSSSSHGCCWLLFWFWC